MSGTSIIAQISTSQKKTKCSQSVFILEYTVEKKKKICDSSLDLGNYRSSYGSKEHLRRSFFCGYFLLFMSYVCPRYAFLSVPCSLVLTCWERAGLFAVLCVVFSCVYVTFPYCVLGQVWYFIVLTPDIFLALYFA